MRLLIVAAIMALAQGACVPAICLLQPGYCQGGLTGTCVSLSTVVTAWGQASADIAASLGLDFSQFQANLTGDLNVALAQSIIADGQLLRVQANGMSTVAVQDVRIGADAAISAALAVQANAKVAFQTCTAAATNAFVAIQAGANATFNAVAVSANKALRVGLQNSNSAAVCAFNTLNLAAGSSLTVSGNGSVDFPSSSAAVNVAVDASVVAAGSAQLAGNLGAAVLKITAAGAAEARASVRAGASLWTQANIQGEGELAVQAGASLVFNAAANVSQTVSATVRVAAQGVADVRSRLIGAAIWIGGELKLAASATASASASASAAVASSFSNFTGCGAGGVVTFQLASTLASGPVSGTILTYAALDAAAAGWCTIRLRGSDGAILNLGAATAIWGSGALTFSNRAALAARLGAAVNEFNAELDAAITTNASSVVRVLADQWVAVRGSAAGSIVLGDSAAAVRAAVTVESEAQLTVSSLVCAATNGFIAFHDNAVATVNSVSVSATKSLVVGVATNATVVAFAALTLETGAQCSVSGEGLVSFPTSNAQVVADASARIVASGGARLKGFLSATRLQIAATGNAVATASVEAGATLTTQGAIVGGTLTVQAGATLVAASDTLSSSLEILAGAKARLQSRIVAGGKLAIAGGLELVAAANSTVASAFSEIQSCDASATITYTISGTFAAAAANGAVTGKIMTYSTLRVAAPACKVQLKDSTGATVDLDVAAAGAAGRRLLGSSTAEWNSNELSYTYDPNGSPASRANVALGLVVALIGARFALF